jgi:hypothetical protein
MSFDLPRSPKGLRFTGSVRALAIGRERPARRQETAPAAPPSYRPQPQRQPYAQQTERQPRRTPRDVYAAEVIPTPYVAASHPAERAPTLAPARPATLRPARARMPSFDDEAQTMALDRDALALGLAQPSAPLEPPRHGLPVPNFRPAVAGAVDSPGPQMVFTPAPPAKASGPGLSLAVWVVAAVIAGMFSYRAAPEALDGIEHAAHALALAD